MFDFKTSEGYTKCPDRVLLKDFEGDGIPELCYGYYYSAAMELGGYVVQCLYINDQEVQEKTLVSTNDLAPIMQEGISFELEDNIWQPDDKIIRSNRERDICSYILGENNIKTDEIEKMAYELVGKHIVVSETIDSLTVGYYDGILYLTLAVITGDVSDSYYRGYAKWEEDTKLRIEIDDSGYSARRFSGYIEVVDGRIELTDVETSDRSPDEIPELLFQWGMNRTTIIATWNDEEDCVDYVLFMEPYKYGFLKINSTTNVIWYGDGKQGDYKEEFYRVQNGIIDAVASGRYYWDDMSDMGNGDEWDYSKAKIFWSSDQREIQCTKQQYDQYREEFSREGGGEFQSYEDYIKDGNGFTSVSQLKKWIVEY